jgi:hypothetical protein
MSTNETMQLQYTYNNERIHCIARHSASNTALIKNPFVLLREQANSSASLLGLIKMAAAGMYGQLNIDSRLQPTCTAKKKNLVIQIAVLL